MGRTFDWTGLKLRLVAIMSSLWVFIGMATAHEVTPTIGDLRVTGGLVQLELRLNIEAFLAGIDLDGLENTDEDDQSARYDALRALGSAELSPRVRKYAVDWADQITITAGNPLSLSYEGARIPVVGNVDLPRASFLLLEAPLPTGAQSLTVTWPKGAGALVLRQHDVTDPYTGYLQGGETSPNIPLGGGASLGAWDSLVSYIPVGFTHIIPKGLDHILFVLGLFFLSARLRPLVWQITAFTLAHTVTLAMGAAGWISINPAIVEPLIAASIVFVALENIFVRKLHPWRPVVIFGFGLLHGLGFASVLGEFGLPQGQFLPALIGFNVGVELGQLAVIAVAFLTVGIWFRNKYWYRGRIAIPASVVIAMIGLFWFVERIGAI
ncbi:HupE/UreJ family protein [Phaeobacter gallaeciensis]|uniref:HupE/UreJ family protein n=2 Tax=Roseobacteraceae TaxID=2854170 RepID=A0A366XB95_9RHOB|nr:MULTISPECIES: HupE/UreJ family protein [Roseobacteraceae]MBT3140510.1 HupE/UreJ family protein [Falsiruegeria litorea]MBT8169705.1 HupE/UreJ family protein [Falsiruegeria litorea]RBW62237.1 HupE/UreJ family protein [Phaeobacter gallaeciensis]